MKNKHYLKINEYKIIDCGDIIKCIGLGSCVFVVIYDIENMLTGGVHLSVPNKIYNENLVDKFLSTIIEEMILKGSSIQKMNVKMSGGATINIQNNVSTQLIKDIKLYLYDKGIKIVSEDLFGFSHRTVSYDSNTHEMIIQKKDTKIII
jgi:chemotaxis protein CheD